MSRPPEHLGPLRLLRQLGVGRRCQIWEAAEAGKPDRVAVKLATREAAGDADLKQLLRHELAVARSLDHPAIIRVDRYATTDGLPHLVMELFRQPNLKRRLTAGPASLTGLVQPIAVAAAEAIAHLHDRGWVHRDLKPENLLVDDAGGIKLIDLALAARPPGLLARMLPGSVKVQGSPSYMPPEQIRGKRVDQRADAYAFGCLLHELVTGRPPFTASTQPELLTRQLHAPPPVASAANEAISPQLDGLLRSLLAKRPEDRPNSMADVVATLRRTPFFKPGTNQSSR
jgi:serine/threonine protein kinase